MKRILTTLIVTALTALALTATPATAARGDVPPAPCPREYVSDTEYGQIALGQQIDQVALIVGGGSTGFHLVSSTRTTQVYSLNRCNGGTLVLTFDRGNSSRYAVVAIAS